MDRSCTNNKAACVFRQTEVLCVGSGTGLGGTATADREIGKHLIPRFPVFDVGVGLEPRRVVHVSGDVLHPVVPNRVRTAAVRVDVGRKDATRGRHRARPSRRGV